MKKVLLIGAVVALTACGTKYDKGLSEKSEGLASVVEVLTETNITANDSLNYYRYNKWHRREGLYDSELTFLKMCTDNIVKLMDDWGREKRIYGTNSSVANLTLKYLNEAKAKQSECLSKIETIKNYTFDYPFADRGMAKYGAMPSDSVLAVDVRMRMKINNIEGVETLVFSLDGSKCYESRDPKEFEYKEFK